MIISPPVRCVSWDPLGMSRASIYIYISLRHIFDEYRYLLDNNQQNGRLGLRNGEPIGTKDGEVSTPYIRKKPIRSRETYYRQAYVLFQSTPDPSPVLIQRNAFLPFPLVLPNQGVLPFLIPLLLSKTR